MGKSRFGKDFIAAPGQERSPTLPLPPQSGNQVLAVSRLGKPAASSNHKHKEKRMNSDEIRGKWNQMKGSVKQQWAKLTDDDLTAIDGHRDRLIGKLQERYGIAREEAEKQLNQWKMPQHQEVTQHEEVTRRKVS
jgi:uncharacterized protein YjbJ (UPF0337 family)